MAFTSVPHPEGPRGIGNSHARKEGPPSFTRPSVGAEFQKMFGLSVEQFKILREKNPELFASLRRDIERMIKDGASQAEVTDYFRDQAAMNQSVADAVAESDDWKSTLAGMRDSFPKAN